MRRPDMSTGAWLFCGIVTAALIAPAGVYAAVNSHVAIGNVGNSTTATVTPDHQLLATTIDPKSIVRFSGGNLSGGCQPIYIPPAGKALMITNVTFELDSGAPGAHSIEYLLNGDCVDYYDVVVTTQAYFTEQHTYPAGLPVASLAISNNYLASVFVVGYLIPASQLPPNVPSVGKLPRLPHR